LLPHDQLQVGSEFFYPLHFSLHLSGRTSATGIVGLAALVMLAVLVSGVVMHRKILRELFTFPAPPSTHAAVTLDLHNLTGVVALPFHFVFALSGLTIFAGIYLPVSRTMLEPQPRRTRWPRRRPADWPSGPRAFAAPLASVDAMVLEAKRRWAARGSPGEVGYLEVTHVGDAKGHVSIYRAGSDRVALVGQAVHFEAATGKVILEEPPPTAVAGINEFLTGLHLQHFPALAAALVLRARRAVGLRVHRDRLSSSLSRSAKQQHARQDGAGCAGSTRSR
jgi:uncharacterized iron-regulated membrane protein